MKKYIFIIALIYSIIFNLTFAQDIIGVGSANFLAEKGIINDNGANPENYRLGDSITRKEVMKIIIKLSGVKIEDSCKGNFKDVIDDWGCKYIESALKYFYIASNDKFRPEDNISKSEVIKLILKAKGINKIKETENWQNDYMETAFNYKIINEKYTDYESLAKREWIFTAITNVLSNDIQSSDPCKNTDKSSCSGSNTGSYIDTGIYK